MFVGAAASGTGAVFGCAAVDFSCAKIPLRAVRSGRGHLPRFPARGRAVLRFAARSRGASLIRARQAQSCARSAGSRLDRQVSYEDGVVTDDDLRGGSYGRAACGR